ncbi:MAG: hypothetical protein KGQ37_07235 [Hyphomicrobiales bacterium]|nr:hypothetical protein [Hyphomicrobiales bacterium]
MQFDAGLSRAIRPLKLVPALMLAAPLCVHAAGPSPCGPSPGLPGGKVTSIDRWLDVHLADGKVLHLAGIWAPAWHVQGRDYASVVRRVMQQRLIGRNIAYALVAPKPDRWRRLDAILFVKDAAGAPADQPLQQTLLSAGLVQVHIAPAMPCLTVWRAAEQSARDAGFGLWSDADHAEVDPSRKHAFARLRGHEIVVRGRVYSVETKGYRTYIRFGPRRYHDFEVSITKPDLKRFVAAGAPPQNLKGHIIRVRGRLSTKFGPQIEVARPQAVEITDTSGSWPAQSRATSTH